MNHITTKAFSTYQYPFPVPFHNFVCKTAIIRKYRRLLQQQPQSSTGYVDSTGEYHRYLNQKESL
jgi:hypothetical protein